jgi:hypothetical protein
MAEELKYIQCTNIFHLYVSQQITKRLKLGGKYKYHVL